MINFIFKYVLFYHNAIVKTQPDFMRGFFMFMRMRLCGGFIRFCIKFVVGQHSMLFYA